VSVSTDPRYRPLASTAIAAMGAQASSSMVAAIVSQWQCEQPTNAWPPRRNNPGNVARGWAAAVGIPYTVEFPNPQPSNPIVTYASAADGARAYGIGIRSFSRYSSALAYARGGDGARYLRALLVGTGYGTSYTCAASVFARLGGQAAGGDVVLASSSAPSWINDNSHVIQPGDVGPLVDYMVSLNDPNQAPTIRFYAEHVIRGSGSIGGASSPGFIGKTLGELKAFAPALFKPGGAAPLGQPGVADIGAAIAGIPAAIGDVLARLSQFAVIAAILLMGLWLVATSSEE
jgi:hypothetical protein